MIRSLRVRLNPQTFSWTVSYAFLEVGIASGLAYFGAGGLTLAWVVLATGVFAAFEHGLFAWMWAVIVAREEEAPQKDPVANGSAGMASDEGASPEEEAGKNNSRLIVDERLLYEEKVASFIRSRSSTLNRAIEVSVAIALACLVLLGSHWTTGKKPPTDQQALVDQLRSDLKHCAESRYCDSGGFGDDGSHPDAKFKQELLDAVKNEVKRPESSWSNSSILGVSLLALLLVAGAVAVVLMIRKRPETAAPLGTIGIAATAIKEAEHLSRIDITSYRIAEWTFLGLLAVFAGLALLMILRPGIPLPAGRTGDGKEKSRVESPLSLLFSALVLLWVLLAICYRPESIPVASMPAGPPEKDTFGYRMLPSIPRFVSGSTGQFMSHQSLDDVAQQIVRDARNQGARADDLLLLLGSADCTAVRKRGELSNKTLAWGRAKALASTVERMKAFSPNHVDAESLHQSESCTGSEDLRAVFPVLIKGYRGDGAGAPIP